MKKYALPGFSKFDTVPGFVKGYLLLIWRVINFSGFSSELFRGARQGAGKHSRSRHDLRRIEQIDSRLYNNKDTQRVIKELGSK